MNKLKVFFYKNLKSLVLTCLALVCALLVASIILFLAGYDPIQAYKSIIAGAFGGPKAISQTLLKSTPLMIIGLAISVAFKGSAFNIGAEGQFYAGALGAVICEMIFHEVAMPSFLLIILCLFSAFMFGGIWGAIPGYLRAARGASEVVTSVMLTSVMLLFVRFLVQQGGPIAEPRGFYPETQEIAEIAKLPYIWDKTRLHAGFLIAIVVVVAVYLFMEKTTWGYKIKATGQNALAAEYGGINIGFVTITTMALSGAIAGLAGGIEVLGTSWKLYMGLSPGYGYNAIAVALLGRLNPFGIIFSALLFGMLNTGSNQMARSIGIPSTLASVLQALVLLFVVGFAVLEEKQFIFKKWKRGETNG
ncbi:MAG: inner-rane translocator [Clostridiales bacterium]|jgi:simple sugar transport system permease protein|nr:inner-rane translocator [Clostridiales bacterium]